ncbi:MAG: hypothetical protein AAFP97_12100, partial [Pseudomonadota bacterium]
MITKPLRLSAPLALAIASTSLAMASPSVAPPEPSVPFEQFVGTWTLKDDQFQQVWDGETVETLTIPNHITVCTSQTINSVSCAVDANGFKGQIFWVMEHSKERLVRHLSHFGERRLGTGWGIVGPDGDLNTQVTFSDEPEGTHRKYEYVWLDTDSYQMVSRQTYSYLRCVPSGSSEKVTWVFRSP